MFDGKSVTMAQIAGDKFVERTTDKVLINLIKDLCGELSQILFKIVLNKGFETTVGIIQFINRDVTTGVTFNLVQLVVIIHVDAAHGHVGKYHAVSTLQFTAYHQGIEHLFGVVLRKSQAANPVDVRTQVLIDQFGGNTSGISGKFLKKIS